MLNSDFDCGELIFVPVVVAAVAVVIFGCCDYCFSNGTEPTLASIYYWVSFARCHCIALYAAVCKCVTCSQYANDTFHTLGIEKRIKAFDFVIFITVVTFFARPLYPSLCLSLSFRLRWNSIVSGTVCFDFRHFRLIYDSIYSLLFLLNLCVCVFVKISFILPPFFGPSRLHWNACEFMIHFE